MLTPEHNTRTAKWAPGTSCATRRMVPVLLLLACWASSLCPASAQATADEYQVKAAFLFHFAQLIEWPSGTFSTASQPLTLCMLNDEPQGAEIRATVDGKLVGDRVLHVRLLNDPPQFDGCSIIFLSSHEAYRQAAVLQALRGTPALTVGETGSFLTQGGMIRFRLEQDRIRFDVDLKAAESARLRISSRLLLLASSVIHGESAGGR